MVKRYRRRRYSRKGNFNKIARTYFKFRLDYAFRAGLDQAQFRFLEFNANNRNLYQILQACADWDSCAAIFHSFKLTGLSMEAIPGVPIAGNDGSPYNANGTYAVGVLTSADVTNFQNLIEAKNTICLTPSQTLRKYLSFKSGETGWLSTSQLNQLDGKIYCETNSLPGAGGMVWTIKLGFYVTFKNSN